MGKPYTILAQIYDELMAVVDYDRWVSYLQDLMDHYTYYPRSILDLACGTGNMAHRLAGLGFKVWGVDLSPDMIQQAESKKEDPQNPHFIQGDMRSFFLPEPVDMVISLYDSVNYLLEPADVEQMAVRVRKVLRPGGLFIFDFNTRLRIRKISSGVHLFEGSNYSCFWEDRVDPDRDRWQVELTLFLRDVDNNFRRYKERHVEQGYGKKEMVELMEKAGLIVEDVFRAYSIAAGKEDDERLFLISRKPPRDKTARKPQ